MKILPTNIKNTQRITTLLCSVIIILCSFFTSVNEKYTIASFSNYYIAVYMAIPIIMTLFDGQPFIRYKHTIVAGLVYMCFMYYAFIYSLFNSKSEYPALFPWFIMTICGIIIVIAPFTVKHCDNTALISIKWYDYIWISIFTVLSILYFIFLTKSVST